MERSKKKYSKLEEEFIVDYIIKNPGNISKACNELAVKLNRTPRGMALKWYSLSKKTDKAFVMFGKSNHSLNRKNTNISVPHKLSLWKVLIKLFN